MIKPSSLESEHSTEFESDVHRALSALQAALTAAADALPEYPRKAPDLVRIMGLERNIAWKLFHLIHERDVFVAARFVPGQASIASFVSGAASVGVPESLLNKVTEAAQHYDGVVRLHAGDRVSADIMLGVKTGKAAELVLRRNAFRSMSFLAGVRAQTQLQTFIFNSGASPHTYDGVSLNGFVELARVRPDSPVVIGRAMATDASGAIIQKLKDEPVDGPLAPGEFVPLLKDFCSTPIPQFRQVPGERGFVENELVEGPVGKTGAITFMTASIIRNFMPTPTGITGTRMVVTRVRTPTAMLICDLLIHESICNNAMPEASVYSDLFGDALRRGPSSARYRLSSTFDVEFLGQGPGAVHTPELPRYTRMVQHVTNRLGWDAARFKAYRVRIEYPFAPTGLGISFDLLDPDAPAET